MQPTPSYSIDSVTVTPGVPDDLKHLVAKLHERLARVCQDVNSDYVRKVIYRELKMFRVLMMSEHGHFLEWASANVRQGAGLERIVAP